MPVWQDLWGLIANIRGEVLGLAARFGPETDPSESTVTDTSFQVNRQLT